MIDSEEITKELYNQGVVSIKYQLFLWIHNYVLNFSSYVQLNSLLNNIKI